MNPLFPPCDLIPDGEAHCFNDGRLYLYGSADYRDNITSYCSHHYRVFSTADLIDWNDHGISFQSGDSHVGTKELLYAPDCLEYANHYYLAYCMSGNYEGLATSPSPAGPFTGARPVLGADGDAIDPALFLDDDGQIYYFWGQFQLRGARLNLETSSIDPVTLKTHLLTESDHGFHEGVSVRKRNGLYYLIYADISRGRPTALGYAIARTPLGPYEKKGIIIDNRGCDPETWNNHGSIFEFKQKWYVSYHRACLGRRYTRRACMESIQFNPDGTINEVEMTTQGVSAPLNPTLPMEGWRACLLSGGMHTGITDPNNPQSGEHLTQIQNGSWACFKYFDFSQPEIGKFTARARSPQATAMISVRLDQPDGRKIADCPICAAEAASEWRNYSAPLLEKPAGVRAVYLLFSGSVEMSLELQSFGFTA